LVLLEGIYSTVIMRDILERENHKGQKRITDPVLLKKLRRGYDVSIGKIDNSEVDFIATNTNDKMYVQVTEAMTSEDVRKRELAPLQKISDNYEKIVLSLNPGMDSSYDGIKSINLIDWLISV
jgi:predicted AAA+ superfamily ATPase